MRNDVSIPPDDSELFDDDSIPGPRKKEISQAPIPPPPGGPIADVQLYDHPDLSPGGAGNFWLLGIIGIVVGILVLVLFLTLMK